MDSIENHRDPKSQPLKSNFQIRRIRQNFTKKSLDKNEMRVKTFGA
jgi:hypothetical protein